MLINLSNHPSDRWEQRQTEAAREYGEIEDMPFPAVSPTDSHDDIQALAEVYAGMIEKESHEGQVTVHIMGEMTFTYALVSRLKEKGIRCIASTSERKATMSGGMKISEFSFAGFREY